MSVFKHGDYSLGRLPSYDIFQLLKRQITAQLVCMRFFMYEVTKPRTNTTRAFFFNLEYFLFFFEITLNIREKKSSVLKRREPCRPKRGKTVT